MDLHVNLLVIPQVRIQGTSLVCIKLAIITLYISNNPEWKIAYSCPLTHTLTIFVGHGIINGSNKHIMPIKTLKLRMHC